MVHSGLPKYAPHSFLRRTRDASRLSVCNEDRCDLVFWTHSSTFNAMSLLIDAATGFTGAVAVGLDCGLKDMGGGALGDICRAVRTRCTFRSGSPLRSRSVLSKPSYCARRLSPVTSTLKTA